MSILSILDEAASNSSRLHKEAVFAREVNNSTLKQVCNLALNPRINFYIKKIPAYAPRLDGGTRGLTWAMNELEALSSRKVTGSEGIEHLATILENVGEDTAVVVERIIARDLRCNVGETIVNKTWPKLIPEYPYMRCSLPKEVKLSKWNWKAGVYSQLKADGTYANLIYSGGIVSILTRNGTQYPLAAFEHLIDAVKAAIPDNSVLNGELLVYNNMVANARQIGNGKFNSIAKGGSDALEKGDSVRFMAWDVIPYDEYIAGHCKQTFDERTNKLNTYVEGLRSDSPLSIIDTRIVYSYEEALTHYADLIEAGFEGSIIKAREGEWKDGTSRDQVKLKIDCDVELQMVCLNAGNGKNSKTFGSVKAVSSDGLFEVNVSGFKDAMRAEIFNNWDNNYKGGIITVRINNITPPTRNNMKHSAFLPRFIEHRPEKTEADSLARIQLQYDNIVKGGLK